jgi:hypothetical protein
MGKEIFAKGKWDSIDNVLSDINGANCKLSLRNKAFKNYLEKKKKIESKFISQRSQERNSFISDKENI